MKSSTVYKPPALELAVCTCIVDLGGDPHRSMSPGEQLVEEDLVDVPTDALASKCGLEAAEQALSHAF
jgi:hypothetical protein